MSNKNLHKNSVIAAYCKNAGKYPRLSREEEKALGEKIQNGDEEAIEKMITSNLMLVVKISHSYNNEYTSIEDLVCEGNLGLMVAAKGYDPKREAKFSAYAAWWIKAYIRRFTMEKNRTIRIPLSSMYRVCKINKIKEEFFHDCHREPTKEELSELTGFSKRVIKKMSYCPLHFSSLEEKVQDESASVLGDIIADDSQLSHLTDSQEYEQKMILMKHVDSLPEREKIIIINRFGLDGRGKRTLDETAKKIGRTRERVRQLQEKILWNLREKLHQDGIHQAKA